MDTRIALLTDCLRQAQLAGQVAAELDAAQLGQFLNNSWQGALLMMKISKNTAPLETLMYNTFENVLKQR